MTAEQRQHLTNLGFPLPSPCREQVRALHEGGGSEGGKKGGHKNFIASTESGTAKAAETFGGCRVLHGQRGPSGTAIFGRPHVSAGLGVLGGIECKCKGYEVDPSLCVCRTTSKPQQFFIGDFADGSDSDTLNADLEEKDFLNLVIGSELFGILVPRKIAEIFKGKA